MNVNVDETEIQFLSVSQIMNHLHRRENIHRFMFMYLERDKHDQLMFMHDNSFDSLKSTLSFLSKATKIIKREYKEEEE